MCLYQQTVTSFPITQIKEQTTTNSKVKTITYDVSLNSGAPLLFLYEYDKKTKRLMSTLIGDKLSESQVWGIKRIWRDQVELRKAAMGFLEYNKPHGRILEIGYSSGQRICSIAAMYEAGQRKGLGRVNDIASDRITQSFCGKYLGNKKLEGIEEQFENGQRSLMYNGRYRDGKYSWGTLETEELSDRRVVYEGNFRNQKAHGIGEKTWFEGEQIKVQYKGRFKSGKCEGNGTRVNYNDDQKITVNGQWVNDRCIRHESVTHTKPIDSPFVFTDVDGGEYCTYIGEITDGKMTGKGKEFWTDAKRMYVGEFKNGLYHGKGTETSLDSDGQAKEIYEGNFRQGKRHGDGSINGEECAWENGQRQRMSPTKKRQGTVQQHEHRPSKRSRDAVGHKAVSIKTTRGKSKKRKR